MNLDLINRNALVCGSSQGIGKAIAVELSLLGANVTLMARNEGKLQGAVRDLSVSGSQVHDYIVADFSEPDRVQEAVMTRLKQGGFHILINNTGGPPAGAVSKALIEHFQTAFSNHLICNHILATSVLPYMKEQGYGRIINIISTSVKQPLKGLGVSNTIRAAVASWAKTLSNEVAPFGVTVNNVLPGATATTRIDEILNNKMKSTGRSREELEHEMIAEIPAGRFGDPHEIAAAAAFLCTPAAAYINGVNVPVDGGRTSCL